MASAPPKWQKRHHKGRGAPRPPSVSSTDGEAASQTTSAPPFRRPPRPQWHLGVRSWRGSSPSPAFFTVMSYNVLCDAYVQEQAGLYATCAPEVLEWAGPGGRAERIVAHIKSVGADVVCLQEVSPAAFDGVFVAGLRDMHGLYAARPDKPDGCAIFFNHQRWALEKSGVPSADGAISAFASHDTAHTVALGRANIGQIVVLRGLHRPARIAVVNTHLLFSPARSDLKLAQITRLMVATHAVLQRWPEAHLVVAADGNCTPHSVVQTYFQSGFFQHCPEQLELFRNCLSGQARSRSGGALAQASVLDMDFDTPAVLACEWVGCAVDGSFLHTLRHPLAGHLRSAYTPRSFEYSSVGCGGEPIVVDHIFHSLRLRAVGTLQLPKTVRFAPLPVLPSKHHPSDHLPLVAVFEYPDS